MYVFRARSSARLCLAVVITALSCPSLFAGGDPQKCDAGEFPDVIVADLYEVARWGHVGDITVYSVGTTSCNIGTCWLDWFATTPLHPVIGQNMYRLKTVDGSTRFEQLGMSWLKHGFFATSQTLCFTDCQSTNGMHLGVHCSDPYTASMNAQQSNLGPRSQVNAATGEFIYPFTAPPPPASIGRRLQVHDADLSPPLNPGGLYFVEGQYVTQDDAQTGHGHNNASYRRITVSVLGGNFNIALADTTQREQPAIRAWKANGLGLGVADPGVDERTLDVPGDGRFHLAAKATDLGGGQWHYEYAVHNLNSHRSASSFTVPLPPGVTVTNAGFHDVDYHSGEPYDLTDWTISITSSSITWSTQTFAQNESANALRWGTMYNLRFEADVPPVTTSVALSLFRPGTPIWVASDSVGPAPGPPAASMDSAVSRKTCDLPLLPGPASEPRLGGVSQVRIAFDVAPVCPAAGPVIIEQATCDNPGVTTPYAGSAAVGCAAEGNELVLNFSPGLENARGYRLHLGPEVTQIAGQWIDVRGLVGDVDGDGRVNGADRTAIIDAWVGAGFTCATDVNNDGVTNGTDRSLVVGAWTSVGGNCAP